MPIVIALSGRWKADPFVVVPVDPPAVDATEAMALIVEVALWLATATAGTPYPALDEAVEE